MQQINNDRGHQQSNSRFGIGISAVPDLRLGRILLKYCFTSLSVTILVFVIFFDLRKCLLMSCTFDGTSTFRVMITDPSPL